MPRRRKQPEMPAEVREWFRKEGARGGKVGGRLSAELLTDEERRERGRQAGIASGKVRAAAAALRKRQAKQKE